MKIFSFVMFLGVLSLPFFNHSFEDGIIAFLSYMTGALLWVNIWSKLP